MTDDIAALYPRTKINIELTVNRISPRERSLTRM